MRRLKDDSGAVAVIVAVLSVAVFGFAALAIDVAALYQERRQLQNGADAAALSVAQGCAEGACTDAITRAQGYVTANHELPSGGTGAPGRGNLEVLCGMADGLSSCTRTEDSYPGKYVVARVTSGTELGASDFKHGLINILPGDQVGGRVSARAVARWGVAANLMTRLPVTIRECRWNSLTASGSNLPPAPPPQSQWVEGTYPLNGATRALEAQQSIVTHAPLNQEDPNDTTCLAYDSPAAGNFSWLETTSDQCEAQVIDGEEPAFDNSVGNGVPSACRDDLKDLVGEVVAIPIFIAPPDGGANGDYKTDGTAAFFVTGLALNGSSQGEEDVKIDSIIGGNTQQICGPGEFCILGFFVKASTDGEIADGATDRGLTVVQMAY